MAELEIHGNKEYVQRMKKHLEQEHPSTRGNMRIESAIRFDKACGGLYQDYDRKVMSKKKTWEKKMNNKKYEQLSFKEKMELMRKAQMESSEQNRSFFFGEVGRSRPRKKKTWE